MEYLKVVPLFAIILGLGFQNVLSSNRHTISPQDRKANVKRACHHVGKPWNELSPIEQQITLQHILVNDKQNILYCYVPKAACSNWKRVIAVLDGNANDTESISSVDHLHGFTPLSSFKPDEVNYRLKNYYKFMFVRDPLDRLVSAYKDKLMVYNEYYNGPKGARIKASRDRILAKRSVDRQSMVPPGTDGVTLQEFFRMLEVTPPSSMDEHWMPYYQLCQPCNIDYDFIGSMENLQEDAQELLTILRLTDVVKFPRKQRMYTTRKYNPSAAELLAQVPNWIKRRVVKIYRDDYELFSYNKPSYDTD